MKTIMSSYNCEPDRGSEFETGWQEMRQLAIKCSNLIVITRPLDSKKVVNAVKAAGIQNVNFIFFDLPDWTNWLKKKSIGTQFVIYFWEIFLFFFLLKRYSRNHFDHAHRATVGSYRFPSFLWYFAPYFTWGPIASGEIVPIRFLSILSPQGRILELLRMVLQRSSLVDPFILLGLYKARQIGVATTATKNILPAFARKKAYLRPDYYTIDESDFTIDYSLTDLKDQRKLSLLYVGRLLEWKGVMFVLKALKQLHNRIDYVFTIIGDGPDCGVFEKYVHKHGLNVNFLGRKPRRELSSYYLTHHLFVSTDLHGRGSNTMVEAKMHNLPVLALDITDPDQLTGKELMVIINTRQQSVETIISRIAQTLLEIYKANNNLTRFVAEPYIGELP